MDRRMMEKKETLCCHTIFFSESVRVCALIDLNFLPFLQQGVNKSNE